MIINDPDNFKAWLTSKLEPLCDADPAALAKYVYALVKKDKPINDLRSSMVEQLEVFLQKETENFVTELFQTLETQVYTAISAPKTPLSPKPVISDIDLRPATEKSVHIETEAIKKTSPEKEDKGGRSRTRRRGSSASPDRRRSRSRSYDRRRSRSRERARAWRNKSPPARRYERRRTYSKSPVRRHSRSRSPQAKRARYRNRSPPLGEFWERKDLGLSPRENPHGDTDLRLPPPTTTMQSVVSSVSADLLGYPRRCRDFDEKGFCMRGDHCPYDHGADPVVLEDVAVPSVVYNSVPTPPTSSLVAPTPMDSLHHQPLQLRHPPPIPEYNPDAPSSGLPGEYQLPRNRVNNFRGASRGLRGGLNRLGPFLPHHQRELINVDIGGGNSYRALRPSNNVDYNGRIDGGGKVPDFGGRGIQNQRSRYPLPMQAANTSLQLKRVPPGINNITHLNEHFSKFGKIVNIQVNFEGDPESALVTFSTHTEANIAYKSTEAVLNNRFIRVFWYNPNNNNENKQENSQVGGPTVRPSVLDRLGAPPAKVLNNIQPSAVQQEEKVTMVKNNLSKTLYISSAIKKDLTKVNLPEVKPPVLENKEQINEELKKKIEEQKKLDDTRKATMKAFADLRKRKQELLEKQLKQQKLLIQRMEAPTTTPQQKSALMSTIKTLQESIEKIRKDLENTVKANLTKVSKKSGTSKEVLELVKKTREEVQKELLDTEMDLIKRQHEGKESGELIKKVSELKIKAFNLGLQATRPHATRGRLALYRGRGRGARSLSRFVHTPSNYNHNVVDHRPTKVLISGYEQDDKAEVLTHFGQYGEVIDYISDDATPSLVLNYKSRKEAEVAISKGRTFQDRLLSVTWATPNNSIRAGVLTKPPTPNNRSSVSNDESPIEAEATHQEEKREEEEEEEGIKLFSPDALIYDDEDEDLEERTWRR